MYRFRASSPPCSPLTLTVANTDFALSLYRSVQDEAKGKNVFFSPISISTALAMTHLGAGGDTATQIGDVLRFSRFQDGSIHQAFKELNDILFSEQNKRKFQLSHPMFQLNRPGYELYAANKLYAKSQYNFVKSYLEKLNTFYGSAIEAVDDFASPVVSEAINEWMSEQTKGKIRDIIPPGTLNDSLIRLVLINAIYFKGIWETQFREMNTQKDVFKVLDDRGTVPTNVMIQSGYFPATIDDANSCLVLEMLYEGGDLSMIIALPQKDDGIGELESKLSVDTLQTWSTMLRSRQVNIFLPKFKLEESIQLNRTLTSMGMPDAFDGSKANFEGISGDRELYIFDMFHTAFVDVNEGGTEAAAWTGKFMGGSLEPQPEPIDFRADHPFVFMIRHRPTEAILFMGRVMDPS